MRAMRFATSSRWQPRIGSALLGCLDADGIERALRVGNSMEGHVASDAAMLRPERVADGIRDWDARRP